MQRAYQFYLAYYIQAVILCLILLDGSIRIISGAIKFSVTIGWLFILANILTVFISLFAQVSSDRIRLNAALKHNIKSQRLDLQKGIWRLDAPLHLESPEREEAMLKVVNSLAKLSPLVTASGFALAKVIGGDLQNLVMGLCFYTLAYGFIRGTARELALASQLKEWEKKYDLKIIVAA